MTQWSSYDVIVAESLIKPREGAPHYRISELIDKLYKSATPEGRENHDISGEFSIPADATEPTIKVSVRHSERKIYVEPVG
jgi:hypothetical protein